MLNVAYLLKTLCVLEVESALTMKDTVVVRKVGARWMSGARAMLSDNKRLLRNRPNGPPVMPPSALVPRVCS